MNKLSAIRKGIGALLLSGLLTACGNSIPSELIEAEVFSKSEKMDPGYEAKSWVVTNEYNQNIEGDDYTVIEYKITYLLSDEDVQKFEAKGYTDYLGRDIYAPQLVEGRLFFVQRGSKWYSRHQNI